MMTDDKDILSNLFIGDVDSQNPRMIGKELFNSKDMKLKSHLGIREITLINKGLFFAKYFEERNKKSFGDVLNLYYTGIMELRASYNRLSRDEFVRLFLQELDVTMKEDAAKNAKLR